MCKVRRKMATGLRERRLAEICKQHIPYWTGYNSKGSSHIISKDCSERKTEWAVTGQEGPLDQRGGQTTLVCPYSSHSRPEVLCIGGHFTEKDSVSYLASSSIYAGVISNMDCLMIVGLLSRSKTPKAQHCSEAIRFVMNLV